MTNKTLHHYKEELQNIDLPNPLFYKKRILTTLELLKVGEGTSFKVLSDPVGEHYGDRKLLFCECTLCATRKHVGLTYLKNKTATCDSCAYNEMARIADSVGLELISKIQGNNHSNLYKFKSCGHIRQIRRDSVLNKNFRCNECYITKVKSVIESSDYSFEEPLTSFKQSSGLYSCKKCKFTEQKDFSSIIENAKCSNCTTLQFNLGIKRRNLEVVSNVNVVYDNYKLPCGHVQSIQKHKAKNGKYRCRECYKSEILNLAEICDLSLSFENKKSDQYFCKLKCGCSQYVKSDQLRRGRVYCKIHDRTRMTSPSLVYLLEIKSKDKVFLKLGFSLDLDKRIAGYKLDSGSSVIKLVEIKTNNGFVANCLENELHCKFSQHNIDSDEMRNYMISGYTECYPVYLKEELISELLKLKENYGYKEK